MQRGLVHALAWSLATGAAVTLSWWGVHTVMTGTAYDPPRAVPISVGAGAPQRIGQSTEEPLVSSTHRASPSPSPSARSSEPSPPPSTARPSRTPSSTPAEPPASAEAVTASGEVKGYRTKGGRVVFELGKSSAKLVSATPEPGWSMQVWTNDAWIRVDFSDGGGVNGKTYSVFCTWNGTPPMVQVVEP